MRSSTSKETVAIFCTRLAVSLLFALLLVAIYRIARSIH